MTTTDTEPRPAVLDTADQYLRGVSALRDHLASHPALAKEATLYNGDRCLAAAWDPEEFAAFVRDLKDGAALGTVTKKADDSYETVSRAFSETVRFDVIIARSKVCERVQVGTEVVEVPDPDAPKVTVERPVYAWDCKPVLALAEEP